MDKLGEKWALENGIRVKHFYPDWDTYGRAAGPMRNAKMAEYADVCIVIWDGTSRGSKSMLQLARNEGLIVFEHKIGALGL